MEVIRRALTEKRAFSNLKDLPSPPIVPFPGQLPQLEGDLGRDQAAEQRGKKADLLLAPHMARRARRGVGGGRVQLSRPLSEPHEQAVQPADSTFI